MLDAGWNLSRGREVLGKVRLLSQDCVPANDMAGCAKPPPALREPQKGA